MRAVEVGVAGRVRARKGKGFDRGAGRHEDVRELVGAIEGMAFDAFHASKVGDRG